MQRDGRVFLTSTEVGGRFCLRASVLHRDTTEADLRMLVGVVRELGDRVVREGVGSVDLSASAFH